MDPGMIGATAQDVITKRAKHAARRQGSEKKIEAARTALIRSLDDESVVAELAGSSGVFVAYQDRNNETQITPGDRQELAQRASKIARARGFLAFTSVGIGPSGGMGIMVKFGNDPGAVDAMAGLVQVGQVGGFRGDIRRAYDRDQIALRRRSSANAEECSTRAPRLWADAPRTTPC